MFLCLQTLSIAFLIFYYNRQIPQGVVYVIVYTVSMVFLLSPLVPMSLLAAFQGINVVIVAVSKVSCFVIK